MREKQRETTPAIRVQGLEMSFGRKKVLREISLEVEAGSVCALLGRNGAGKSTLVRVLLGQIRASGGDVELLGRDPWKERRGLMEEIGYVPEAPDIPPELALSDVLTFCSRLHRRWNEGLALSRLEHFGLGGKQRFTADRECRSGSGCMAIFGADAAPGKPWLPSLYSGPA